MGAEGSFHRYLKCPVNHYLNGQLRKVGYTYTPSASKALLFVDTRQALDERVHSVTAANAARLVIWLEETALREVVHAFGWDTQGGGSYPLCSFAGPRVRWGSGFLRPVLPRSLQQRSTPDTTLPDGHRPLEVDTSYNIFHAVKSRDDRYKWLDTASNWG